MLSVASFAGGSMGCGNTLEPARMILFRAAPIAICAITLIWLAFRKFGYDHTIGRTLVIMNAAIWIIALILKGIL